MGVNEMTFITSKLPVEQLTKPIVRHTKKNTKKTTKLF